MKISKVEIISPTVKFSTWQSIFKQPKSWFDQFDVILGDEAHLFKAQSLVSLMNKMTSVAYRIGTTGSLDSKSIHQLQLEGLFGKVYKITTTKKLQDTGKLSQLHIKTILLKYPEKDCKDCCKVSYQDEIKFLISNEKRNKFLCNLALKCKGNTLLLFNFVEQHGSVLYDMIQEKSTDRNVYFIHGGVAVNKREDIRTGLSQETNAIVVSSFGTMSTGINIPSIENIIFASPSKSVIRVLQSLGRGLRLNEGKTHCNLFDLIDDLHHKKNNNHSLRHGAERFKIYINEQFKVKSYEVNI